MFVWQLFPSHTLYIYSEVWFPTSSEIRVDLSSTLNLISIPAQKHKLVVQFELTNICLLSSLFFISKWTSFMTIRIPDLLMSNCIQSTNRPSSYILTGTFCCCCYFLEQLFLFLWANMRRVTLQSIVLIHFVISSVKRNENETQRVSFLFVASKQTKVSP